MKSKFGTIGLVGKPNHKATQDTLKRLHDFLSNYEVEVVLVNKPVSHDESAIQRELTQLGQTVDLAIVVGGDGNMLGVARALSKCGTPVIGVNRGNLGFLTDLHPDAFETTLKQVLQGKYKVEERFLLKSTHHCGDETVTSSAVNEIVLHSGQVAQMMEFEVYIDNTFMFSQRADGLIICTPTGSTAYSLSGGGPILTPNLEVVCLQPMFPHSLSNRPIVVDANSTIKLVLSSMPFQQTSPAITFDGHFSVPINKGDEITIQKQPEKLKLIHPHDYSYYNVIRRKLNWGSKLY